METRRQKKRKKKDQHHLKTTKGIYLKTRTLNKKNERGSTSGAGDLPGCQLEANCPGPEEVDYQNIDNCESQLYDNIYKLESLAPEMVEISRIARSQLY